MSMGQGNITAGAAAPGVTGGYDGDNLSLKIVIAVFVGLALYNSIELILLILLTFARYSGLYFWSLLTSSFALVPYSLGFLFKFYFILGGTAKWASVVLLTIGWWGMVTGQAVVLWSRLHLIVSGDKADTVLKWTKWMIIIDFFILHLPTTVVTFGSNGDIDTGRFASAYNVIEKYQMTGFFIQEVILSVIYIVETTKILRSSFRPHTKEIMRQLVLINVLIILMDIALLAIEYASLFILETIVKGFIYSVKLKLEFAILSRLVTFVGGGRQASVCSTTAERRNTILPPSPKKSDSGLRKSLSGIQTEFCDYKNELSNPDDLDISDCVDLTRVSADYTHASPVSPRQPGSFGGSPRERDFAVLDA